MSAQKTKPMIGLQIRLSNHDNAHGSAPFVKFGLNPSGSRTVAERWRNAAEGSGETAMAMSFHKGINTQGFES